MKVNLKYLNSKLQDSGHINKTRGLNEKELIELLKEKFSETDFEKAKKDVKPFLKQNSLINVDDWNSELFIAIAETIKTS